MGAKRWINFFDLITVQPSEFIKIAIILLLSKYYNNVHRSQVNKISLLILPFAIIFIPGFLIFKQPNLGTVIIIIINFVIFLFLVGIKKFYFILLSIIAICLLPMFWLILHQYQKNRILNFLNPEDDPLGYGYNIIQSKISIGSGGLIGKGFINGSQNYLKFLPENHTDFIFSLIAEEGGLIFCLLILLLYVFFFIILLIFSIKCKKYFSRLFISNYASLIFLQIMVNLSMVSGLLPVIGSPLPFISFGGSNMLAMILGAVISVNLFLKDRKRL